MNLELSKLQSALEISAAKEEEDKERLENEILIEKLMAFSSTGEVDFSVYTPEKIIQLMHYIVDSSYDMHLTSLRTNQIISAAKSMPKEKPKRFACM